MSGFCCPGSRATNLVFALPEKRFGTALDNAAFGTEIPKVNFAAV